MIAEESSDLEVGYTYNDLSSVERALASVDGDCAAIFVGGASYPYSAATECPLLISPEVCARLRRNTAACWC